MPAGDLVVADYQLELRTTLMGYGTDIAIDRNRGGIAGLLDEIIKIAETDYAHADGAFIGESYTGPRTATFALRIDAATPAAAGAALETMRTTWTAATEEQALYFQLPGVGKSYVLGWPLGIVADYTMPALSTVPFLASFRITDPTIYDAGTSTPTEETTVLDGGTF